MNTPGMRYPGRICSQSVILGKLVRANFLGDQLQNFIVFRKTVRIQLGEDGVAIDRDLEPATVAWLEGNFGEVLIVLVYQHFHRTGGFL